MPNYKLVYTDPAGVLTYENIIFSNLSFMRKENEVGQLSVVLPPLYPSNVFTRDGRLELYRSVGGAPLSLLGETSFLIERVRMAHREDGGQEMELTGNDMLTVLRRRLVAYEAASTYTVKIGLADDLMKDIIRENYGASALDAARDLSAYLSVAADVGAGAAIAAEISWKNVLDVLGELASASALAGVRILFDIVKTGANAYEFRTYQNYRGVDHSATSASPVVLSLDRGNLSGPELIGDWFDEKNYVYSAGRGEDAWRPIEEVQLAASIAASPFARCELFHNEGNSADPETLTAAGERALEDYRPRIQFNAQALDTPSLQFGQDYGYGDLVTATYGGVRIDCRINAIKIDVGPDGERLDIRLQSDSYVT